MTLKFEISEQDSRKAKIPHEIFLTNLIFNHVLVFVAILSASSLAQYVVIVPIASISSLLYLFWGASRAKKNASWYVSGHWQLAAKRSRIFLIMISLVLAVFGILWLVSGGHLRPQHWALGSAAFLPTMVTVLALIIMESEALHYAKIGLLPDWILQRFPKGALQPIVEEEVTQ